MKKKIAIVAMAMAVVFALAACQSTDVVAKVSVTSFESVVNKLGDKVAADEKYNAWALTSPAGDRFLYSKDFSGNQDTMIEIDATPFVNAGLDASKLPSEIYTFEQATNRLLIKGDLGSNKLGDANSALDTFKQIVKNNRESIGYHQKLDHYGIAMGNGNMFEWAKDMSTNDKDIVFVLNPQPFIDAGVDTTKLTDWVFAEVPVMDENNKEILVEKFLRPFELSK